MTKPADGLVRGEDGEVRCWWCVGSDDYRRYHDEEWGIAVVDDRLLFEKICLEGFQAGLSWLTILRKRPAFRRAFAGFDFRKVARFGERDVARLLGDEGIVRHRGKIEAVINNAKRACDLVEDKASLAAHFWSYEPLDKDRPKRMTRKALVAMTTSPASIALSKDLKKRGWGFVGPTTIYAFMQAMGIVNDHLDGCHARERAMAVRRRMTRPGD